MLHLLCNLECIKNGTPCFSQNISNEMKRKPDYMVSISQIVTDVFALAVRQAFPDLDDIPILIQKGKFADYQCNSAMSICQVS